MCLAGHALEVIQSFSLSPQARTGSKQTNVVRNTCSMMLFIGGVGFAQQCMVRMDGKRGHQTAQGLAGREATLDLQERPLQAPAFFRS